MQRPTKAFADMMCELADKLQAVLGEMYPDADSDLLIASPKSLRDQARRYAEIAERADVTESLTEFLSSYWYLVPSTPASTEAARAEALALLEKFDIRPKAGV